MSVMRCMTLLISLFSATTITYVSAFATRSWTHTGYKRCSPKTRLWSGRALSSTVVASSNTRLLFSRKKSCCDGLPKVVVLLIEIASDDRVEAEAATAADGQLHRFLASARGLRLLDEGGYGAATMTDGGFLVLSNHDQEGTKQQGRLHGTDLSGFGIGTCQWTTVTSNSFEAVEHMLPAHNSKVEANEITAEDNLRREIESLVTVVSTTEIATAAFRPTTHIQQRAQTSMGPFVAAAASGDSAQRSVGRLIARFRVKRALAKNKSNTGDGLVFPFTFPHQQRQREYSEMTNRGCNSATVQNPLLLVNVGRLLPRQDCDKLVNEAREMERATWQTWDGDGGSCGGKDAMTVEAISLAELPESRWLWEKELMGAMQARVASAFGVPNDGIILGQVDTTFVCKILPRLRGPSEAGEGTYAGLPPVFSFRRSTSLIAFAVALSPESPEWTLCLEQRGQCIRPCEQGAGVIFSGKLRHAVAGMQRPCQSEAQNDLLPATQPHVFILRGFASIRDPSISTDVARWQWGKPAWHVDANWVKDEDILHCAWVGEQAGVEVGSKVINAASASETATGSSVSGIQDKISPRAKHKALVVKPPKDICEGKSGSTAAAVRYRQPLQRANSSLAHRYFRQGGGQRSMDIPVVDSCNHPVIDLRVVPWISRSCLPWRWGQRRQKPKEITIIASLHQTFPRRLLPGHGRKVGKAGLSVQAGTSLSMDAALQTLFGGSRRGQAVPGKSRFVDVPVPPIKYVFVDPRYRGLRLGRRLFLEAMCFLAERGFRFALIIVEDNGSGGLFGFYEEMGFVKAEEQLGIPRVMIAPIPPSAEIMGR